MLSTRYQVKIAVSYVGIILLILILLNTYPIAVAQSFVFQSKESGMLNRANLMSAPLSDLEKLTADVVSGNMNRLSDLMLSRTIVTDQEARVIYDNAVSAPVINHYALQAEIVQALKGHDVFSSTYDMEAFESKIAMPIISHGEIIGAVYLYEYDADQASLLSSLQKNIAGISIVVAAVVVLLSILMSAALSRRISELLRGIRMVREGEYSHRVPRRGQDELGDLADEFNELTGRIQKNEALRRQFVSDASHELKTPLASIRLLADSILQTRDMDVSLIREFVADIGDESSRLTRMTEKLLSLTRLDAELLADAVPVDINTVVGRALRRLKPLSERDEVELRCHMDSGCCVMAAEDDLFQIVFNLVENAIKYNRPGGTVDISLFIRAQRVTMTIRDTGIGIPADQVDHVFDRFFRVDKTRSRAAGGAGLGLSIVRDAVERHNGDIALESRVGEGTFITISFPVATMDDLKRNDQPEQGGGDVP